MEYSFPVVPICDAQKLDVREEDLLMGGLYRKCNTYRGGGGYDQFNKIWKKRMGYSIDPTQFVVQLKGCPLNCPYCYVTREGVKGYSVRVTNYEMLFAYKESKCEVFHLMGGAPALYLHDWKSIADRVKVFHSDFILVEHEYNINDLIGLPGLHAVSLKDSLIYSTDQINMIFRNLKKIVDSGIDFYLTFTGNDSMKKDIVNYFGEWILRDSFVIDIVNYDALE